MRVRRPTSRMLASLCALAWCLLVWSDSALAARGHVFGSSFGSSGAGAGQFSAPTGVAVDEKAGVVYVVDKGNNRVEHFSSAGAYLGEINGSGLLPGEGKAAGSGGLAGEIPTGRFSEPEWIAFDNSEGSPSFGDLYVADVGHNVIDKYSSAGAYLGQLTKGSEGVAFTSLRGLALDSQGNLWVCQQEKEIDAFNAAAVNEFISDITSTGLAFGEVLCGFAVDSHDDLYTDDVFTGVGKLNSSGAVLIEKFDTLVKEPVGVPFGRVAVDLSNNEVYIGNADNERSIGRFTSKGLFVEKFGSEHLTEASGIAVDSQTGEVYIADAAAARVIAFAPEPEAAPTIVEQGASEVTATSATLDAQITPMGPSTSYYFQYGPASCAASPSPCTDLPAPPGVEIGGGFEAQNVSVHTQALQPNTVYHFRVVATNVLGADEGAKGQEGTFTTQAAATQATMPDGRQWEMVTPPDKHGAGLFGLGGEDGSAIQAAADGAGITYTATGPLTANPAGSRALESEQMISTRQAPGSWGTADITTSHNEGPTPPLVGDASEYKLFSSDLSAGAVEPLGDTPQPPLPAGSERTIYRREASGAYQALVTAANVPPGTKFGGDEARFEGIEFVSASPDLSHVVLHSAAALEAGAPAEGGLYEWAGGQLHFVSVLPNAELQSAGQLAGSKSTQAGSGNQNAFRHAISDDGSRIAWEMENKLYLRDMARRETVQVDAAQGAPEPPSESSTYWTANGEGSRVFFTSPLRLTADSTGGEAGYGDLYVFEVTSGGKPLAGTLTDLTVDRHVGQSADVMSVIGASENGSYVYFVASGALGNAPEGGNDLYVEHYETATGTWAAPTLIASLAGGDAHSWGWKPGQFGLARNLQQMTARVSPDGRYLTFMSERSLTGYDNRDAHSGAPDQEVFLYDSSSGRLVCVSCNPTGARPLGVTDTLGEHALWDETENWHNSEGVAASVPGWTSENAESALYQSRYLSDSGRLFFNSSDALVPADVNGKVDVYEYEPVGEGSCQAPGYGVSASVAYSAGAGGCVGLISAGTSSEESAFLDASETGGDVFFLTASQLLPQDYDASYDIYDAHECTTAEPCAPPAPSTRPPCTTESACRAAPMPQPTLFGAPSSETFSGTGNIVPPPVAGSVTRRSSTRAQRLATALKACKKRRRRAQCERQARRRHRAQRSRVPTSRSAGTRRQADGGRR